MVKDESGLVGGLGQIEIKDAVNNRFKLIPASAERLIFVDPLIGKDIQDFAAGARL